MTTELAPVAVFAYNRPDHLAKTLASLQRNKLADRTRLKIFLDGPRADSDAEKLSEVRKVAIDTTGFRAVEIIESDVNLGLANSITGGVSRLLEEAGKVIVLEDDLKLSKCFLAYMNDALDMYEHDERVFQISGYMVPCKRAVPTTGFLRTINSWGWGTWSRAWRHYNGNSAELLDQLRNRQDEFDLGGVAHHYHDLQRNVTGAIDTWAVKWYASVFLQNGLTLYPRRTLVSNLGFDGSGTHCARGSGYRAWSPTLFCPDHLARVEQVEHPDYYEAMRTHYLRLRKQWTTPPLSQRVVSKLRRLVSR